MKIKIIMLALCMYVHTEALSLLKDIEKVRRQIASTLIFVARTSPVAEIALAKIIPKKELAIKEATLPLIPVELAYRDKLSIIPHSTWLPLDPEGQGVHPFHLTTSNQYLRGIKQLMLYQPEVVDQGKQPIVIVLTHGTFARENNDFAQEEHIFYRGVKRYAQLESIRQKTPVVLVTYQWEGDNSSPHRVGAGTYLANIINTYFGDYQTILISHSHGGNVVNYATRLIDKPIDLIVHIATPSRDEERFKPQNFKKLLSLYSIADAVQIGGAVRAHQEIITRPLWASLIFTPIPYGSQEFENTNQNVYNIRTRINGEDPGHSTLKIIPWFLQPIQEMLNMYQKNHNLNLNVDLSSGEVMLALNKTETPATDEQSFSDEMKELFMNKYGKNMDQKGSVIDISTRALSLIIDKSEIIDPETGLPRKK